MKEIRNPTLSHEFDLSLLHSSFGLPFTPLKSKRREREREVALRRVVNWFRLADDLQSVGMLEYEES